MYYNYNYNYNYKYKISYLTSKGPPFGRIIYFKN